LGMGPWGDQQFWCFWASNFGAILGSMFLYFYLFFCIMHPIFNLSITIFCCIKHPILTYSHLFRALLAWRTREELENTGDKTINFSSLVFIYSLCFFHLSVLFAFYRVCLRPNNLPSEWHCS
jgi:hypothetical protein